MKSQFKFKKTHLLVITVLFSSTSSISFADSITDKLEFSKSDSIISDRVFYQIGGGTGYMAPPSRGNTKVVDLGIGWKANLTCGNFDIKTTIKNDLNGLKDGFKDLMGNVIDSAKGAVASMPAMILQRANPQLYDLLTNGMYQGKLDFNRLKTSCEEMSKVLADHTLGGKWGQAADLESYKQITSTQPDAKQAQKDLEDKKGKDGRVWVGGQRKGGQNQDPINVVGDVAKGGFNLLNKRNVLDSSPVSNCEGNLCQTWDTPQAAADFLTKIIGEQSISTCKEDCGTKTSSKAGVGLSPEIEEEHIRTIVKLENVLNMDVPKSELLAELSSSSVPVTRGLIESLRDDPDVELLSQRLSAEIATSKVMEKMLLARRAILAGMREPNVAQNADAQVELERVLNIIDREISQVKLEMDMQKMITGNTASVILQSKSEREALAGAHSLSQDSLDKRVQGLENGNVALTDLETGSNINLSRRNIALSIPNIPNVAALIPTLPNRGGSGVGGNFPSLAQISGSTMDQATGLLRNFEGFISKAQWDVNAHRVGYGSDTITRADGTVVKVTKDTVITKEDAERDLARRTAIFANNVRQELGDSHWNALPANAQAVLVSYAYNYGSLAKTKSVLDAARRSAQTGDMTALATAVRNRQVDNNGINARRRNQEADYILGKN
ncbi:TPA: integrating conjugative element protein [Mannheimia haemolytica]|uniref:Lysozyme n=2 Tax=Mannheimia haemolytica TaxID=75985 RepID=A0A547E9A1_MANHA|nr:integrating conjugative element protein [Mannheimia haemolytica]AGI32904.2 integrating conjugative element protein [Mannheimia haemolytica USDA-ARS-USMARC-183]AGK02680.1 integrating conjugative element protein [Mannheimia haemolytica M42548]AKA11616.1 membrane protein [Mannheimia haemolytica]AKA14216.1 membrane protein [Mannheimia haemolytica]ASW36623.1 integrating conjugative element protein [Mannheimia haemolytica]